MIPDADLDFIANRKHARVISTKHSKIKVYVIPAGEERWMAQRARKNIA